MAYFRYLRLRLIEEQRAREERASLIRHRIRIREENYAFNLPDTEFVNLFRIPKNVFIELVEQLRPFMSADRRSTKVTTELRILSALNFFAVGSYQRSLGSSFTIGMAQPTVSKYLMEVCLALTEIAGNWIQFPDSEDVRLTKKREFYDKFQFPGAIGAIDGTHVPIIAPSQEEAAYFNRKGYHSKNVQIICDANMCILSVNARYGGSAHDSFVWANSQPREILSDLHANRPNEQTWLIISFCHSRGDNKEFTEVWDKLANALNALGFGEKTAEKWRIAFGRWKSKVKGKCAVIGRECRKTGGGPSNAVPLSELEERLMALIGKKCVVGDIEGAELGNNAPKSTFEKKMSVPGPLTIYGPSCSKSQPEVIPVVKVRTATGSPTATESASKIVVPDSPPLLLPRRSPSPNLFTPVLKRKAPPIVVPNEKKRKINRGPPPPQNNKTVEEQLMDQHKETMALKREKLEVMRETLQVKRETLAVARQICRNLNVLVSRGDSLE